MRVLFILCVICLIGCSEQQVKSVKSENISPAQRTLLNILDSFKTEFYSANSNEFKDSVVDKWQIKLHTYVAGLLLTFVFINFLPAS